MTVFIRKPGKTKRRVLTWEECCGDDPKASNRHILNVVDAETTKQHRTLREVERAVALECEAARACVRVKHPLLLSFR